MIHTLLKHCRILVKKLLFRTSHTLKRSLMGTFTLSLNEEIDKTSRHKTGCIQEARAEKQALQAVSDEKSRADIL